MELGGSVRPERGGAKGGEREGEGRGPGREEAKRVESGEGRRGQRTSGNLRGTFGGAEVCRVRA